MRKILHGPLSEVVDKTNELCQLDKSFRPPFSKGGAVEAAEASSPSADGETPLSAFSFVSFSFAPAVSKEKRLTDLCDLMDCVPLVYSLRERLVKEILHEPLSAFSLPAPRTRPSKWSLCSREWSFHCRRTSETQPFPQCRPPFPCRSPPCRRQRNRHPGRRCPDAR